MPISSALSSPSLVGLEQDGIHLEQDGIHSKAATLGPAAVVTLSAEAKACLG
jgi:hypothetical protein